MGWELSTKKEGEVTKYRIWSTTTDKWLTKWLTRDKIMYFLFWHRFNSFVDSFMKDVITFPHQWGNYDEKSFVAIINKPELMKEFNELMEKDNDAYFTELAKHLSKLGIIVNVSDSTGTGFNSDSEEYSQTKTENT